MAVTDARRLKVSEQARGHWGEVTAEVLMELVVPAGQDMATKADIAEAVSTMKEYTLHTLLIALTPLDHGMVGLAIGVTGLHFSG